MHNGSGKYYFNDYGSCKNHDIDKVDCALGCEVVYCNNLLRSITMAKETFNSNLLSEDPITLDPKYKLVEEIFSELYQYYSDFNNMRVKFDAKFKEDNKDFLAQKRRY
jgi:hypothetical protein